MFDWSTPPLYDSSNSNIKIVYKSIEHFLWNLSDFYSDVVFENLCCLWIVFINSVFQVPPQKIVRGVEIWGIGWPGLSVWCKMSPSLGKYCLRNSSAGTPMFISMPLFLLNAGTNFLHIISMYCSALMVTQFPSLSPKKYGPKIPPLPIAHHTVTFSWLNGR